MIDRVAADLGRRLDEVPVGFKWFVPGLLDGTLGFGGEESAGASFLRRDGTVWTTDKDGLILGLLAAEMKATTGRDPGELYAGLTERFGRPAYRRIDVAASPAEKDVLKQLSPDQVPSSELAGDPITAGADRRAGGPASHRSAGSKVVTEQRLVRGPAVGHRGRLQGVRRVDGGRGAPSADPDRGRADRVRRAGRRGSRRRR